MPRLRPRTSFSAAFIVVAACGGPNPDGYSENPPPPVDSWNPAVRQLQPARV